MKFWAQLLSFVFHPVPLFIFMPFLIIYRQTDSGFYAMKWWLFSLIFIALAILLIVFERVRGVFSDFDISKRKERNTFYFIVGVFALIYFVVAVLFKGVFFSMSIIALGIIAGVVFIDLANRFVKVSVHSAVCCAWVLSIGILYGKEAMFALSWIIPVTVWARLKLKKHTLAEAVIGIFIGTLVTFLTFTIGKHLLL